MKASTSVQTGCAKGQVCGCAGGGYGMGSGWRPGEDEPGPTQAFG